MSPDFWETSGSLLLANATSTKRKHKANLCQPHPQQTTLKRGSRLEPVRRVRNSIFLILEKRRNDPQCFKSFLYPREIEFFSQASSILTEGSNFTTN